MLLTSTRDHLFDAESQSSSEPSDVVEVAYLLDFPFFRKFLENPKDKLLLRLRKVRKMIETRHQTDDHESV